METKTELITPERAKFILEHQSIKNRKISRSTVEEYARDMKEGRWYLTDQGIAFDKEMFCLNGHHRLHAVILSGVDVLFRVTYGIDRETYPYYDKGKSRNGVDYFYHSDIPRPSRTYSSITAYVKIRREDVVYSNRNLKHLKMSESDLAMIYKQRPDFWDRVALKSDVYYDSSGRLINRAFTAGLITFLIIDLGYKESLVYSFFDMVSGIRITHNNAINTLRKYLIKDLTSTKKMTDDFKLNLIKKVWNRFVTGTDTGVLKWNSSVEKRVRLIKARDLENMLDLLSLYTELQ